MPDIINLLPDSIANQIAAGEVVQRPASVVKELLENSIDAHATQIRLIVYEGGKNGIQVIDNGDGMSPTDARLCFERHATSKIAKASDLEAILTMGFRGEALASIASIAEVTLVTKRKQDEIGCRIILSASRVIEKVSAACSQGSNFSIRNLFFNVPARRRFLKSTPVEMRHVTNEFLRVALAHPTITMQLFHQQATLYNLPPTTLRDRIAFIFGKEFETALIPINIQNITIVINGFILDPSVVLSKRFSEQFFYVNNRYMRNPYFHRAIQNAYERLLPPDAQPSYFLFFTVDPHEIDVNIHPTKTEIKFQNEHLIWEILFNTVRAALGQSTGIVDIEALENQITPLPQISAQAPSTPLPSASVPNYSTSIRPTGSLTEPVISPSLPHDNTATTNGDKELFATPLLATEPEPDVLQYQDTYLVVVWQQTLRIINQHRAHARVLYEQLEQSPTLPIRSLLYPAELALIPSQRVGVESFIEQMSLFGLSLELRDGKILVLKSMIDTRLPLDPDLFLDALFREYSEKHQGVLEQLLDRTRAAVAFALAYKYATPLPVSVRRELVTNLMATREPLLDPKRRPTMYTLTTPLLEKLLRAKS